MEDPKDDTGMPNLALIDRGARSTARRRPPGRRADDTLDEAAMRAEVDVDELKRRLAELERERDAAVADRDEWKERALLDTMTGLPNRRAFEMQLERRIAETREYKGAIAVILVDLRNLKQINHTYGMPFADNVLRFVAKQMMRVTRHDDSVFLARLGGDENALILTLSGPDIEIVHNVAKRIFKGVDGIYQPREGSEVEIRLSVAIGGFLMSYHDVEAGVLYDGAAANLEEAKEIAYDSRSIQLPIVITMSGGMERHIEESEVLHD